MGILQIKRELIEESNKRLLGETDEKSCPPKDPNSPFYTNLPEFCYKQGGVYFYHQPGEYYHNHPDTHCCDTISDSNAVDKLTNDDDGIMDVETMKKELAGRVNESDTIRALHRENSIIKESR